jgi:hypothetical protein
MDSPLSNALANPFCSTWTDGGRKLHEPLALSTAYEPRPKTIAKKRKLLGQATAALSGHIAAHNLRFLRVQLQPALPKPLLQRGLELVCFGLTVAVHHGIVSIAGERQRWKMPFHPFIKYNDPVEGRMRTY